MHVADVIRFKREMKTYTGGGRCGLSLLLFLLPTVPVLCLHALSNLLILLLANHEQQQQDKRRNLTSQDEVGLLGNVLLRLTVDLFARLT
jgi:hypothetical protein